MSLEILVTGPSSNLERYAEAGVSAGWRAHEFPLLEIRPRRIQSWREPDRRPDWICVTSQNALVCLELEHESLKRVPCATVGLSTAARLREMGFRVEVEGAHTARELYEQLIVRVAFPCLVLWPRSSRANELGALLRGAGVEVWDPVAYDALERAGDEQLPETDAVFLTSPSAVRAHARRVARGEPMARYAIAIGPTTEAALGKRHGGDFARVFPLGEPSPAAFRECLLEIREMGPFA